MTIAGVAVLPQARHLQRYRRHHSRSIISSIEVVLGVIVFAGVGPVSVTSMLQVQDLGWQDLASRRRDIRLALFYKIVNHLVTIYLPRLTRASEPTININFRLSGQNCASAGKFQILFLRLGHNGLSAINSLFFVPGSEITAMDERSLVILYGSQTGTAADTAERIWREAKCRHFKTRLLALDEYPIVRCFRTWFQSLYVINILLYHEHNDYNVISWQFCTCHEKL